MSDLTTEYRESTLEELLLVSAKARQHQITAALSKYGAIASAPIFVIMLVIWLRAPQYNQFIIYALIDFALFIILAIHPVFERLNRVQEWTYLFFGGALLIFFAAPLLMPPFFPGMSGVYLVLYLLGYQLIGDKPSRWLIVLGIICFVLDYLLLESGARTWFPLLDASVSLVMGSGMGAFLIAIYAIVVRPIMSAQEQQYREIYQSRVELEHFAALDREQRAALEESKAEVEQRAVAAQQQREQLEQLVAQVNTLIETLNGASAEIQAASTQQVAGAIEQETVVTQTVATVEEMRVSITQTAERAQAVAAAAQESVEVSRRGEEAVEASVKGMRLIGTRVDDIAQTILILSERTQQIGEIIDSVNTIADQSKLLALNASIEAARAGSEGRGFAVVAAEVRQLAEQSRQATARIGEILHEIQQASNRAVMVTEEGGKQTEQGLALVNRAGEAIRELAITLAAATQSTVQIAASTHQQTNGMSQLATAMEQIRQSSTQSKAGARQTEQSIRDLNQIARQLEQVAKKG